jgi:hypothetical protein
LRTTVARHVAFGSCVASIARSTGGAQLAEFAARMRKESENYGRIIREENIKLE